MSQRPLTYRAELIGPVLRQLAAGECVSVVGMSGVGKTNALQQLQRPEVLRHHLGATGDGLRFATIDSNALPDWSPWGLMEGWLATLAALPELDAGVRARVAVLHAEVLADGASYVLAMRRCADALALICGERRLVLIFDEFDPLFAQLPGAALRNLRGLRDRFKYRLAYLTFSRQPLLRLRDDADWDEVEPFVELLTASELGLGPLQPADAAAEAARIAMRLGAALPEPAAARVAELSGGHPALARFLVQRECARPGASAQPPAQLLDDPALRLECLKIWQQLSDDEQDAVVRLDAPGQGPPASLMLKGLVRAADDGRLALFSPLLAQFVAGLGRAPAGAAPPILVDLQRQQVSYYGQEISDELPPLEYRLLAYLWSRYGTICPKPEVAAAVYANERGPEPGATPKVWADDLERLQVLARRLRQRLERLRSDQPCLLYILKGRGYRLGHGD